MNILRTRPSRIYLDYAAATPLRKEVIDAMEPYVKTHVANPSAIHTEGQTAKKALEDARTQIAHTLAVRPQEVTFTSGGTESNNLALLGVLEAALRDGKKPHDIEVISTKIEHPSILETLEKMQAMGVTVTYVPVDVTGRIVFTKLKGCLSEKTLLITFAYVNSEVGVVEDVKRIAHLVRTHKKEHPDAQLHMHLDASQAPLWLPCKVDSLGVDLMTLDAGKMYGPKGVGVLVHKQGVPIHHYMYGGDQESGLRAGTENVAGIVGAACALTIAQREHEPRAHTVSKLREYCIETLEQTIEGVRLNGSREHRVANNINMSIEGLEGEYAVVTLDVHGIAASTRSACSGTKAGGSHVVRELTGDVQRAEETIRLTLGEASTKRELDAAITVLKEHAERMRR